MKSIPYLFAATLLVLAFAIPASAQEQLSENTGSHVVHMGNREFVVGATTQDLNIARYRTFQKFADDNPDVVKALSRRPRLIESQKYLSEHGALAQFLNDHPDIKTDFSANPGNYVLLEPGAEKMAERSK